MDRQPDTRGPRQQAAESRAVTEQLDIRRAAAERGNFNWNLRDAVESALEFASAEFLAELLAWSVGDDNDRAAVVDWGRHHGCPGDLDDLVARIAAVAAGQ